MTNLHGDQNHSLLQNIAHKAMLDRGFLPDFSNSVLAELKTVELSEKQISDAPRDLRSLVWCSIDNDDSRDLDQLSVAMPMENGTVKVLVAVADVDSHVKMNSAIDEHARHNTTSVYTAAQTFPMLPEKLSTDLTSLNCKQDRLAMVVEMLFADNGLLIESSIYQAKVNNQAKLTYNGVGHWLENKSPTPFDIALVNGLDAAIKLQDTTAQKLKSLRQEKGALDFETLELRPVFEGDTLKKLDVEKPNRAKSIIEEFMIAANGVTARYLAGKKMASIRRVVRTPKYWAKIVELAAKHTFALSQEPDQKSLEQFLVQSKAREPGNFADLSLSVIKLLGPGEYIVEQPGKTGVGHFGLAERDYTHSTAPNRRFPDIIAQRLLKAALAGNKSPYTNNELEVLAAHCTEMENNAKKVERQLIKSAAALLLHSRIGELFSAVVTGATQKGVWVRISNPPIEGKLTNSVPGIMVGQKLCVKLMGTNVERGFIDFETHSSN